MPEKKGRAHGKRGKRQGYILFETVLAMIAFDMLSVAFFTIFSGQFSMVVSSRDALQAQQYAQVEAEMLRITEYENLSSKVKARSAMTSWSNPDGIWESAISLDDEVDTSVGKTRIAHVSVYRRGDSLSRFSLDVPLSSQVGSAYVRNENYPESAQISMYYDGKRIHTYYKPYGGEKKEVDNFAIGTISPYIGNLSDIPDGWHLCDGSGGTIDLRGMFLRGYGSQSYTQENGRRTGSGSYTESASTTVHSSGSIGSIQGDALRADAIGIQGVFHTGEDLFRGSGGGWRLYESNSNFWGSAFYGDGLEGDIHYMVNPKHYRYRPIIETITIPGGEDGSGGGSFTAVTGLEEYTSPVESDESAVVHTMVADMAGGSLYTAHNDNEIRPVNRAVYFIQKVGT